MRRKLHWASGIAVAAMMLTALIGAPGAGAMAEESAQASAELAETTIFVSKPVIQELPSATARDPEKADIESDVEGDAQRTSAKSLAEHISLQTIPTSLSPEMHCLAGAIYFEARGESLDGQLAVGRVVVERANSRRFPSSYCDVVFQRSQFSFVRGNRMPRIKTGSKAWAKAMAIAQIAHDGSWESPVEGALFFHATQVSPGWRLTRMDRIDNHIFYR